jgi:hypothetical protein
MFTIENRRLKKKCMPRASNGFTLTELMIASFLTLGIVAIGGVGLANMITASQKNDSEGERRVELNRALTFISAETQEASKINTTVAPSTFTPLSTEVDTTTVQQVLRLTIPGVPQPVIYYLATPASSNLKWRGSRVLYRWGPTYGTNGIYGTDKNTPSSWPHQALVDGLDNSASTPSCGTGWTASPSTGATGFYACIDSNSRVAKIYNKGRVTKVLGQTTPYLLSSQAFARSSDAPAAGPLFTITGGGIVSTSTSTISAVVLGSDWRGCSGQPAVKTSVTATVTVPSGATAPTPQTITIDPSSSAAYPSISFAPQPAGSKVSFIGNAPTNSCNRKVNNGNGWNSLTDTNQVIILRDGDAVPTNGGQGPDSLSPADYVKDYVDSTTKKIKLPDPAHQAIILFELGVTDKTQPGYDLQDVIILATIST